MLQYAGMPKRSKKQPERPPHYLREWREFRKFTQEQLADLLGTNASVISLLETSGRKLSDKWLGRLAPVLRTSRGAILDYDPKEASRDILDLWSQIPKENQSLAMDVLRSFAKTGTDN